VEVIWRSLDSGHERMMVPMMYRSSAFAYERASALAQPGPLTLGAISERLADKRPEGMPASTARNATPVRRPPHRRAEVTPSPSPSAEASVIMSYATAADSVASSLQCLTREEIVDLRAEIHRADAVMSGPESAICLGWLRGESAADGCHFGRGPTEG
jgi:hypothetical protein